MNTLTEVILRIGTFQAPGLSKPSCLLIFLLDFPFPRDEKATSWTCQSAFLFYTFQSRLHCVCQRHPFTWQFMTWDAPCPSARISMQQEALVSYGSWGVFAFFSTPTIFPGPFSQEHVSCKNMNLSSPAPHRPIHMLFIKSKNKKNAISRKHLKISISFRKREGERENGHVFSSRCHECLLWDTWLSLTVKRHSYSVAGNNQGLHTCSCV